MTDEYIVITPSGCYGTESYNRRWIQLDGRYKTISKVETLEADASITDVLQVLSEYELVTNYKGNNGINHYILKRKNNYEDRLRALEEKLDQIENKIMAKLDEIMYMPGLPAAAATLNHFTDLVKSNE